MACSPGRYCVWTSIQFLRAKMLRGKPGTPICYLFLGRKIGRIGVSLWHVISTGCYAIPTPENNVMISSVFGPGPRVFTPRFEKHPVPATCAAVQASNLALIQMPKKCFVRYYVQTAFSHKLLEAQQFTISKYCYFHVQLRRVVVLKVFFVKWGFIVRK